MYLSFDEMLKPRSEMCGALAQETERKNVCGEELARHSRQRVSVSGILTYHSAYLRYLSRGRRCYSDMNGCVPNGAS